MGRVDPGRMDRTDAPSPFERAFFREDDEGTTVFFPWGLARRGYELRDEATKRRASRAASGLIASAVAVGTWIAYRLQPLLESEASGGEVLQALLAPVLVLAAALLGYWSWVSRLVERLPESGLVISREERFHDAAEQAAPWKVALAGLVLFAGSLLVLWLQPSAWWLALLGAALGAGLVYFALVLRRAVVASGSRSGARKPPTPIG